MCPGRQEERVSSDLRLSFQDPCTLAHPCPPTLSVTLAQIFLFPPEIPRPGQQQQEARSFWSYAFSRRFAWHLVWLSVIQLWHYLFIGTLNSLLSNLASGDRVLGM